MGHSVDGTCFTCNTALQQRQFCQPDDMAAWMQLHLQKQQLEIEHTEPWE
jgi:hypothetical protein